MISVLAGAADGDVKERSSSPGISETIAGASIVRARCPRCTGTVPLRHTDRPTTVSEAARRAAATGITAVWTGDFSATIVLARLTGPHGGLISVIDVRRCGLSDRTLRALEDPVTRASLYARMLNHGSPFDCYRWVNLLDLAAVWRWLDLPAGIRAEWRGALRAAGLLD